MVLPRYFFCKGTTSSKGSHKPNVSLPFMTYCFFTMTGSNFSHWVFLLVNKFLCHAVLQCIESSNTSHTESHTMRRIKLVIVKANGLQGQVRIPHSPHTPAQSALQACFIVSLWHMLHYSKFRMGLILHTHTHCNLLSIREEYPAVWISQRQ